MKESININHDKLAAIRAEGEGMAPRVGTLIGKNNPLVSFDKMAEIRAEGEGMVSRTTRFSR